MVGAGVALLLMPVLVVRGSDPFEPTLVLIIVGAVGGMILGITRRPTVSQTALRADRQLGLHDLLSTALMSSKWNDTAFADVILAQADAACLRRSPSEIIVARLSRRAWGGIAVVGGLALALALLLQGSPTTLADGLDELGIVRATPAKVDLAIPEFHAAEHAQSQGNRPVESGRSLGRSSPGVNADTSDSIGNADRSRGDGNSSAGGNGTQSVDVAGTQEARTGDAHVPTLGPRQSSPASDQLGGGSASVGGSHSPATSSDPFDSTPAARDARGGAAPALNSPGWTASSPADKSQSETDVPNGRVPNAYRDVVLEYFSNR